MYIYYTMYTCFQQLKCIKVCMYAICAHNRQCIIWIAATFGNWIAMYLVLMKLIHLLLRLLFRIESSATWLISHRGRKKSRARIVRTKWMATQFFLIATQFENEVRVLRNSFWCRNIEIDFILFSIYYLFETWLDLKLKCKTCAIFVINWRGWFTV